MTKLELELSDVVTIKSKITPPTTFFVKYIDSFQVVLINIETFSQTFLEIDRNTGDIKNYKDITEIVLVYRNPIKGFAAQNNLVLNTWVELEVNGEEEGEFIITQGQIVEVNGDQLGIQLTMPSQALIYIDFEYKGLDDSSPIKTIRLISSPVNIEKKQESVEDTKDINDDKQIILDDVADDIDDNVTDGNEVIVDSDIIDDDDNSDLDKVPELIVEFKGDAEDTITELIDVDHSKNVYDIESQKLDLINSMLMSLPEHKRTDVEKAKIYKMIDQFVRLRTQYSKVDDYGNIIGVKTNKSEGHPLSEYFENFNSNIRWLIPGVHSTKKTYNTSNLKNNYDAFENINIVDDLDSIQTNIDTYRSSSSTSGINAYKQLYRQLHPKFTPFSHLHNPPMSTFEKSVKRHIHAIENPTHSYEAITAEITDGGNKYDIMDTTTRKFVGQEYLPEETMLTLDAIRGTTKTKQRPTQLTRPDKLHINSFLVMPDTVVNYSKVSLPGTNIMERANLANHGFESWKVLNKRTRNIFNVFANPTKNATNSYFIPTTPPDSPTNSPPGSPIKSRFIPMTPPGSPVVEDSEFKSTLDSYQFVQKSKYDITNVTHLNNHTELSYSDLTKNIMPSLLETFETLKPELYNVVSFEELVRHFEPYLVYTNNLTHNDRYKINQFVKSNIEKYEQDLNANKSYWLSKPDTKPVQSTNSLIYDIRRIAKKHVPQDNDNGDEVNSDNIPNLSDILALSVKDIRDIYDTSGHSNNIPTTSEFLSNMYKHDGASGLTTIINMDTLNNTGPSTLSEYVEQESISLKSQLSEIESNEQTNTCANVIAKITAPTVSKLYSSPDALLKDNRKSNEIYADAQNDTTPYHLLGDAQPTPHDYAALTSELASKHTNLTIQDIKKLVDNGIVKYTLIRILMEKYQITRPEAYDMATHILAGRRIIVDGDYAGIGESTSNIHSLYQRQNGVWVEKNSNIQLTGSDNDNSDNVNLDPMVKCNLTPGCISTTPDQCRNIDARIVEHQQQAISNIYETFKSEFNKDKTVQLGELKQTHERNKQIRDKLKLLHGHVDLLANNKYYKFGHTFAQDDNAIISPASHILSVIMKHQNFRKLQSDIVRFVTKFTRPYSPHTENIQSTSDSIQESPFWLYCKKTGLPLLPVFKYELANVFITNESQYPSAVLDAINTHGVLSDDGDMWVDKNTGMVIRSIEFDTSEGFDEAGFKITTRTTLDPSDDETNSAQLDVMPMTATLVMIKHIVTAFTSLMGISFDTKQLQLVFRTCTRVVDHNMGLLTGSEQEYAAVAKKRLEKGVKMPSYKFIYHKQIIYTIVGLILIVVQTSIPSIKRLKTVPGCIQSFNGYPLEQNESTQEGLTYIACILKKLRSRLEPWNSIHKQLPDIITSLITTMRPENKNHMGLLTVPEVVSMLESKRQHEKTIEIRNRENIPNNINNEEDESIPMSNQLQNDSDSMFLPPQMPFKLGDIAPLQSSDKDKLLKSLKNGLRDQTESILEAKSKLLKFSLKLQELVEKIIKTESDDALLIKKINGELYLENACCIPTEGEKTVIQYFKNKDPEFGNIMASIASIESLIQDIGKISKVSTLMATSDTRRKFLTIVPERTVSTIHTGVIQLCKIGTGAQPPMSIKQYCQSALDVSKNISSSSLEELLELFQEESVSYTPEQFSHILQIVHSYNSLNVKISYDIPNPYTQFDTELDKIDIDYYNMNSDGDIDPETTKLFNEVKLIEFMKKGLDNRNNNQEHSEKLNEFLSEQNNTLKSFVWIALQKHGGFSKITKGKREQIKSIISKFTKWNDMDNKSRNTEFYKTQIQQLIKVIPSIILNSRNIESDTTNPRLRPNATVNQLTAISQGIKKSYEPFLSLFDIPITHRVLHSAELHNNSLLVLSETTPALLFSPITTEKLYEYYFLKTINNYIVLSQTREMVEDPNNQPSLKLKISNMLVEILQDTYAHKKTIDITHEHIMDRVFKRREIEKNAMIQKNRKKTVDETVLAKEISRITVEVHDKYQLDFSDPFDANINNDTEDNNDIEQEENDLIHNEYGEFE
jgi:hypothetical protein